MAGEFVHQVKFALHSNGEESLCRLLTSCEDGCSRTETFLTYLGLCSGNEPECYPGECGRGSILVELLVQTLNFAVEKGLPYAQIYHFLCLYVQCLDLLCPKQHSDTVPTLSDAVKQFQEIIQMSDTPFFQEYRVLAVQYITQSLLQHYHLYQYLLSAEQPVDLTVLRVDVETADSPQPLANSTTVLAHERQQRMRELETAYTEKDRLFTGERQLALQQEDEKLKESYKCQCMKLEDAPHLAESDVVEVIDSLAKAHAHAVLTAVSQEVKRQALDMDFHVDKLNVFAPQVAPKSPSPHKETPTTSRGGRESKQLAT